MSDIATKLTYLNETKSQLKDMINYGLPTENQITNETTFRNYVKGIFEAFIESLRDSTTLYTNLPKISGNGTQITLNDTANAPMRITLNPTAISQTTYTGKNKISILNNEGAKSSGATVSNKLDNSFTLSGTTAWGNISYAYTNDKNKDFTINANFKDTFSHSIGITVYGTNVLEYTTSDLTSIASAEATLTANTISNVLVTYNSGNYDYVVFRFWNNRTNTALSQTSTLNITNLQLEQGSTATEYEPYVGGTSSPNPSYPQDIHTISGSNSVVVEGKNVYNATTLETTYRGVTCSANETIVKVNGTRTSEGFINFEYFTLPAGTYTLNVKLTTGSITNRFFIALADSNNTEYVSSFEFKSNNNYTNSKSFTLSEEKSLRFRLYVFIDTAFTNAELSYQVTTGSTSDYDFEPYVSQTSPINLDTIEYCKIGNYEDEFILTSGKNLFNKDVETKNAFPVTTVGNSLTFTNSTVSISYVNCAYLEAGKTYKLSWKMTQTPASTSARNGCIVDNNNIILEQIQTFGNNASPMTITPTHNGYLVLCTDINASNIMLNEGSTALPYEPYGTNQWYLKKNIGKVVLDGSESYIRSYRNKTDYYGIAITNGVENPYWNNTNYKNNIFCDKLVCHSYNELYNMSTEYEGICLDTANAFPVVPFVLMLAKSRLSEVSANGVKEWLSNNNTTIYYQKSTPTYTQITGTLETQLNNIYKNMLSYKGTTNVSQINNDLPFVLGVSAIQDLE